MSHKQTRLLRDMVGESLMGPQRAAAASQTRVEITLKACRHFVEVVLAFPDAYPEPVESRGWGAFTGPRREEAASTWRTWKQWERNRLEVARIFEEVLYSNFIVSMCRKRTKRLIRFHVYPTDTERHRDHSWLRKMGPDKFIVSDINPTRLLAKPELKVGGRRPRFYPSCATRYVVTADPETKVITAVSERTCATCVRAARNLRWGDCMKYDNDANVGGHCVIGSYKTTAGVLPNGSAVLSKDGRVVIDDPDKADTALRGPHSRGIT